MDEILLRQNGQVRPVTSRLLKRNDLQFIVGSAYLSSDLIMGECLEHKAAPGALKQQYDVLWLKVFAAREACSHVFSSWMSES